MALDGVVWPALHPICFLFSDGEANAH